MRRSFPRPGLPLLLLLLGACQQQEITGYRARKVAAAEEPSAPAAASSPRELDWTLPKGWTQLAPSQMRVGSFSVRGKDGATAEVSIVVLAGDAGGDLANVNRWRGQLGLAPIGAQELASAARRVSPGGRPMTLVDFATAGAEPRKRLVAATHPRRGRTWFFKMTGEDALVASLKPQFLNFLATLAFHD